MGEQWPGEKRRVMRGAGIFRVLAGFTEVPDARKSAPLRRWFAPGRQFDSPRKMSQDPFDRHMPQRHAIKIRRLATFSLRVPQVGNRVL